MFNLFNSKSQRIKLNNQFQICSLVDDNRNGESGTEYVDWSI